MVSFQFEVPAVWIAAVLTRPFGAGGVHAEATCMKACDDVQSPAGLALSIWVTTCKVPAAAVIIWTATGSAPAGLLPWKMGIVHLVFGVLFLAVLARTKR